mgnify:CR=1 FL=1
MVKPLTGIVCMRCCIRLPAGFSYFTLVSNDVLLVDSVVQLGARLELDNLLGCYLYLLLGCGVDALACGALVHAERAEANQ